MIEYSKGMPFQIYCDRCQQLLLDEEKVWFLHRQHLCTGCLEEIIDCAKVGTVLDEMEQFAEEMLYHE